MWYRYFKDYPPDSPLIQEKVEPNHGIIGCEMHESNGWGDEAFEELPIIKPNRNFGLGQDKMEKEGEK